MHTELAPHLANTTAGIEAAKLLAQCVHCGFCGATCPTYQLLGDELDSPRGRIYLIKQMAEGSAPTEKTRLHLDRCLTCLSCETTCPSGVQYGNLLDIGRQWAETETPPRPFKERFTRWLLREVLTRPWLFNSAINLGRIFRPLMPLELKRKIPSLKSPLDQLGAAQQIDPHARPITQPLRHARTMLVLEGCVQPAMLPNINSATARVLDTVGVNLLSAAKAGCCGALRHHLNHQEGGLVDARRNIDAWWPYVMGIEPSLNGKPIEAIVMTASGCGAMVSDYGHLLRGDPQYADKAKTISKLCKDLSEILPAFAPQLEVLLGSDKKPGVVYHPPCTLQHGQQIRLNIERLLSSLGVQVALCADSHLCCGSAGTYSILQPELSTQLRQQKLANLNTACAESGAKVIVSANVGCITHLQQESNPVVHWVEILDQLMQAKNPSRQ